MLEFAHERVVRDHIGRRGEGLVELCRPRAGRRVDLAIIMAGTNDLAHQALPVFDITQRVRGIHEACHESAVCTVALAVPDQGARAYRSSPWPDGGRDRLRRDAMARAAHEAAELSRAERRRAVNAGIAAWTREEPPVVDDEDADLIEDGATPSLEALLASLDAEDDGEEGVGAREEALDFENPERPTGPERPEAFFNAGALLPHGPKTVRAGFWEKDGVHLTASGAKEFGRRLGLVLRPLVARLRTARLANGGAVCSDEDGSVLSLDAYLNAFREEDELGETGDDLEVEDVVPMPYWEELAAVVIQRAVRTCLLPTRLCVAARGSAGSVAACRSGHVNGASNGFVGRTHRPIDSTGGCNSTRADMSSGSDQVMKTVGTRSDLQCVDRRLNIVSDRAAGGHGANLSTSGPATNESSEDVSSTSCKAPAGLHAAVAAAHGDAAQPGAGHSQSDVATGDERRHSRQATSGVFFDFDALSEDEA